MSIFSKNKPGLLHMMETREPAELEFPHAKLGNLVNGYSFGDFVLIGGRKTGGRGAFALNTYVIHPLLQAIKKKLEGKVKIIYFNNRQSTKFALEKMIVNLLSTSLGGNKLGIPTLYGMKGSHLRMKPEKAKDASEKALDMLHSATEKGILDVVIGSKNVEELTAYISSIVKEYGDIDPLTGAFLPFSDVEIPKIILVIDDIPGLLKNRSKNTLKSEAAIQLGAEFRAMAKTYNMLVVATMPANNVYRNGAYNSNTEELQPLHAFADRALVLHNPVETDLPKFIQYVTEEWINKATGICYFRSLFIAANSMGASGVYIPMFLYPENGLFKELPRYDEDHKLQKYYETVVE